MKIEAPRPAAVGANAEATSKPKTADHADIPAFRIRPAACSTARSATTWVASRRVAAAYGVAHLALRTPFYVQNHDARSASTVVTRPLWAAYAAAMLPTMAVSRPRTRYAGEHWSTGVVLLGSRP